MSFDAKIIANAERIFIHYGLPMSFIADLHLHSKFSRATSRDMTLDHLAAWARVKGVHLLATGDFTHPEWLFLMKEKLEPAGNGFLRLRPGTPPEIPQLRTLPPGAGEGEVQFILSSEVSFIYSKGGKVRKIHLMVLAPDFEAVEKLNGRLSAVGNLRSDGRPIVGLDARLFLRMVADACPRCVVIPSHVWTPWFSLFGANSGFDTIEECFEEMTPFVFALETGLSSDPAMNGRLSALDRFTLVSNSDAHSPSRIGREANVVEAEFSYRGLVDALRRRGGARVEKTIEFFPEEGKYHYDGHRKCGIVLAPRESLAQGDRCPRCGKPLTIGVLHRVEELADRAPAEVPAARRAYVNLVPLNEIVGEALEKSPESQGAWDAYARLVREFGTELKVLTEVPVDDLVRVGPERVARGIDRMRRGAVRIVPGHDGEYGTIKLFEGPDETGEGGGQLGLF